MKVEDDRGNTWLVLPGDPASEYVNALKRRNYSWVVLPVKLLAYGAGHGLPKLRLHTDLERGESEADSSGEIEAVC